MKQSASIFESDNILEFEIMQNALKMKKGKSKSKKFTFYFFKYNISSSEFNESSFHEFCRKLNNGEILSERFFSNIL